MYLRKVNYLEKLNQNVFVINIIRDQTLLNKLLMI